MELTLGGCTINTAQMLKEARMDKSLVFPPRKTNNNLVQHSETLVSPKSVICISQKVKVPKRNTAWIYLKTVFC